MSDAFVIYLLMKVRWAWKGMREQKYAAMKVQTAIRKGILVRPKKCSSCGKTRIIYAHHSDYTKPMKVIWLCASCYRQLHLNVKRIIVFAFRCVKCGHIWVPRNLPRMCPHCKSKYFKEGGYKKYLTKENKGGTYGNRRQPSITS